MRIRWYLCPTSARSPILCTSPWVKAPETTAYSSNCLAKSASIPAKAKGWAWAKMATISKRMISVHGTVAIYVCTPAHAKGHGLFESVMPQLVHHWESILGYVCQSPCNRLLKAGTTVWQRQNILKYMCWLRIEGLANMCLQLKSQVIHMCLVNRHALRQIGKSTERIHALFIVVLCPHDIYIYIYRYIK